ncbi:MAG: hypothetical protein JW881_02115 [Spirochaetales bacterium]|nr:hypothetical protein [Spirochaetales bacterium]
MKSLSGLPIIIICLIGFLVITDSCETSPPQKPPSVWLGMLPGESSLLIGIRDAGALRPIIENILAVIHLDMPDTASLLDKTEMIFASVAFKKNGPPVFYLLLVGRYSTPAISLGLGWSGEWRWIEGPPRYWEHKRETLNLAHHGGYQIMLTNGDIETFISRTRHPESLSFMPEITHVLETSEGFVLFPSFGENAIPEEVPVNTKKLPIREVWCGIGTEDAAFRLCGAFNLLEGPGAKLFFTTFKTFIIWLMRNAHVAGFVGRIDTAVEGGLVTFKAGPFTEEECGRILEVLTRRLY